MKAAIFSACACLSVLGLTQTIQAQDQVPNSSVSSTAARGSRQQDKLNGQVRRVRIEKAKVLFKDGKTIEAPRVVREITTYDPKGQTIDSVAYPEESSALAGKAQYQYDDKGNVTEMLLRGNDGSVLSKEKYDYQFDEFENWKKMTASIVVYENGNIAYEPFEITYRTITYYFNQAGAKIAAASTGAPALNLSATSTNADPPKGAKPTSEPAAAAVTNNEKKPGNSEEAIATKPDKSEASPIAVPAAMTSKDASNLPVVHRSEEALRKAAIDLPQPEYPKTAMSTRAEGNVEVQILVDEKGEVMNASAVSGNPLFSEGAAAAARKARFSRAKLSREPARIYGVINYSFTMPREKPTTPPSANHTSSEVKTRQSNEVASESKLTKQSVDSSEASANPASDSKEPATSFYTKGLTFLASGRYADAAETLKEATRRDPNDAAAYAKLGLAYAALRNYQEAIVVLKMAIRIKPELVDAEAYYQLGNAYLSLGKNSQALETYKQAMYIKRAEKADPELGNATKAPSFPDLHYSTGLAYYNLGRFSGAIEELKQAIALNPDMAQAYYGLGLSQIASGDRKSAEKQEKILESLNPLFAAKLAKALATNPNNQQGIGFVFKNGKQ
jgi:TonB family protein